MPVPAVRMGDHLLGRRNAKVTLIEYSDFECPFCARQHETMKKIIRAYRGKVTVVYRHFPLPFHASAEPAALASECVAKEKGNQAFWQFADALFTNGAASYESAAARLGIPAETLRSCMASATVKEKVANQKKQAAGPVTGTPTSFLVKNGTDSVETLVGSQPFENFALAIDGMLQK